MPWHQDSGYFEPYCDLGLILTIWLPLVDVDEDNGCPWIAPGLHRGGTLDHWITPIGFKPDMVPGGLAFLVTYNPIAHMVTAFRSLMFESQPLDLASLAVFFFELRGQDALQQVLDETVESDKKSVELTRAPWAETRKLPLNPGLIAIIGARGSGKTALADNRAAIEALNGGEDETRAACEVYERRHRLVADTLNSLGWSIKPPRATFYVWAPVPPGYDSIGFAGHVLDEVGVNITPGVGFGAHGEGYFRLSVTAPDARLEEAMTRLRRLKL